MIAKPNYKKAANIMVIGRSMNTKIIYFVHN